MSQRWETLEEAEGRWLEFEVTGASLNAFDELPRRTGSEEGSDEE
jgi:hypothetical protein